MTALTAGGADFTPHGASELKTGGRAQFSRGLAGSSAVHFLLLALFLAASGTGERTLRVYSEPFELIPEPVQPVPPPVIRTFDTPPGSPRELERGLFDPVVNKPDIDVKPVPPSTPSGPIDGDPPGRTGNPDPTPPIRPDGPESGRIYVVVEQLPVPVVAPKPAYPPWAQEAGITGRVLLHVLVGEDGRVRKVVVKEGVMGLSEAASDGVRLWVFRPATVRGVAVSTWVSIPVVFRQ